MKITLTAIALVLVVNGASFAQQPTPAAQTGPPEENYVTEKGFKSKVFTITNRDVNNLGAVLRPLLSGFKGAIITSNGEFKTLTVRDFPENLATIDEAIKRLDTPSAPRPNIELHMHVLLASNISSQYAVGTPQFPAELKDVLTQLRGTLNYQDYQLATSVIQRLTETPRGLRGKGTAEVSGAQPSTPKTSLPYEYVINSVSLVQNPTGPPTVQINEFGFFTSTASGQAQVQTSLNLRDGEKVVVGTATISDRALIIVLTAKVLN
jgi:hypothetical protein